MSNLYYNTDIEIKNAFYGKELVYAADMAGEPMPGFQPVDASENFYWLEKANSAIIQDYIPADSDPLITDFTIVGLKKRAPHYDRGKKIKAQYLSPKNEQIVVEKIFQDVRDPDTGRLTALAVIFNWYDYSGQIALTKTEVVKELNKAQAETVERQRRERAIDFLISEARYTPNEPYVTMLMLHYETQINHFKSKAANDFQESLQSETDPTILAILAARVPFASNADFTVPIKESILYQIGAINEDALLTTLEPSE